MSDKRSTDDQQGEGDYAAAERYESGVRDFVKRGKVQKAARDAAPGDEGEKRELERAEEEGLAHAHGHAG